MNQKPLVGVLKNSLMKDKTYRIADELDLDLFLFTSDGVDWEEKTIKGLLLVNGKFIKRVLPFPDSVYLRKYTSSKKLSSKLEKIIGQGKVFNSVTRFNKWKTYKTLQDSCISSHLPNTYRYNNENILELLDRYGKVIIKPERGFYGKKIYAVEKCANGKFNLYHHFNSPEFSTQKYSHLLDKLETITSGKSRYIVQEFINFDKINNQLYDIRLYVQRNGAGIWGVTGGLSRVSGANFFKTNFAQKLINVDKLQEENNNFTHKHLSQIKKISLQIVWDLQKSYSHLGDISVDLGLDTDGNVWIIEVNGKPRKKIVTRIGDEEFTKKAYLKPLEYARFLALNQISSYNRSTYNCFEL